MAEQPKYIVRGKSAYGGPKKYVQTDVPLFKQVEKISRTSGERPCGRHADLLLLIVRARCGVWADGKTNGSTLREYFVRDAAGVKTVLRRLRPQEAERLVAVDIEIERLDAELAALRSYREGLVSKAWTKAHVVTLKDVESLVSAQIGADGGD